MALQHYFAPCPRGLETALAQELGALGASGIESAPGGVLFQGDLGVCYRANLNSRIATRILRRVGHGSYANEDEVYRLTKNIDWPGIFKVERTLRVYVTAKKSPLASLEYITLRIKDAVCDRFRDACNQRPSVDTRAPDIRIHAFLTDRQATLYVDTSGEALSLRGQKIAKVHAPLKENLAAGILRLTGWQPDEALFDPMCGSGTFLMEAAQSALNIAPGLSREADQFGFCKLKDFDAALWRRLRAEEAQAKKPAGPLPIFGADISADAVARSAQNLAYAGLEAAVTLLRADLLHCAAPAPAGVLVANPPYGERLGEDAELAAFYPRLGDHLKKNFAGWRCYFLSADTRLPKLIGLKAGKKTPLFNGALECRLYEFIMVAGQNRP